MWHSAWSTWPFENTECLPWPEDSIRLTKVGWREVTAATKKFQLYLICPCLNSPLGYLNIFGVFMWSRVLFLHSPFLSVCFLLSPWSLQSLNLLLSHQSLLTKCFYVIQKQSQAFLGTILWGLRTRALEPKNLVSNCSAIFLPNCVDLENWSKLQASISPSLKQG